MVGFKYEQYYVNIEYPLLNEIFRTGLNVHNISYSRVNFLTSYNI